jgi:hypothetical protein
MIIVVFSVLYLVTTGTSTQLCIEACADQVIQVSGLQLSILQSEAR